MQGTHGSEHQKETHCNNNSQKRPHSKLGYKRNNMVHQNAPKIIPLSFVPCLHYTKLLHLMGQTAFALQMNRKMTFLHRYCPIFYLFISNYKYILRGLIHEGNFTRSIPMFGNICCTANLTEPNFAIRPSAYNRIRSSTQKSAIPLQLQHLDIVLCTNLQALEDPIHYL